MALDPEIVAFAEESDRLFGPDYDRLPIGEQRRLYDAWCRHFSAPFPADVDQSDLQFPGPDGSVRAKLFRPAGTRGTLPVVVFYHGGGWILGSPETHAMATGEMARRTGAAVLSVDYRLAPEHAFPAAFDDAYAALTWVSRAGGTLGLDPGRIAVAGDSAGGNLAAAVALAARDRNGPKIALQALIYPALKATRRSPVLKDGGGGSEAGIGAYVRAYSGGKDISRIPYAMPLSADGFGGLPPAFIAAAGVDAVLEDAEDYAAALAAAGVPVTYRCAETLPHAYLRTIYFCRQAAVEFGAVCDALARALGSSAAGSSAAGATAGATASAMASTTLMAG
ncbi:MAG TPA: alpha/beta hydrolase [Dongiaceae bacterium]|nr:alpha/beta hydrolase [Dongiaceae bacterium]